MTFAQIAEEVRYRTEERLAILCGDQEPTPEQKALAEAEANQWKRDLYEDRP
jgi:hypothetical protein